MLSLVVVVSIFGNYFQFSLTWRVAGVQYSPYPSSPPTHLVVSDILNLFNLACLSPRERRLFLRSKSKSVSGSHNLNYQGLCASGCVAYPVTLTGDTGILKRLKYRFNKRFACLELVFIFRLMAHKSAIVKLPTEPTLC